MNLRKRSLAAKIGSLFLLWTLIITSCVPPTEEVYYDVNIDYDDPEIRKIIDLQVKQDQDSLLSYTGARNPAYRYVAANAFASYQTEAAVDTLISLLKDPFIEVKTAAAFALGQIGESRAATPLLQAFSQQDSIDVNNSFNAAILEAMGKIGPENYLQPIATVSTYRKSDTLLLKGQVNAIYQYGLRDVFAQEGDQTLIKYLTGDYPISIKKMAAQYFYRFEEADLSGSKFQILKIMKEHPDPDIRMALATALTRLGDVELQTELFNFYSQESDYRVKCNILRQLHHYPYINVVERVLGELSADNVKVGLCAAEYLLNHGNAYDAPVYRGWIKNNLNPSVQIKVHQAILRNSGNNSGSRYASTASLKTIIEDNTSEYVKASGISALSEDPRNYDYLIENYDSSSSAIIRTKTVESIVNMLKNENFYRVLGGGGGANARQEIAKFLEMILTAGRDGEVAAATEAFTDEELKFDEQYENVNFLDDALNRQVLPDEMETYNALNRAIARIKGESAPQPVISDNIKPIDWELFAQYSTQPKIRINTTKGEIEIQLYKEDAPQSVMNVIELAKSGFYNNKFFHRVVPNFVAQAGCPDGDGYGSLDFTIRSELNNVHYNDEGYIGFASAGPHTESTQWFITYSPTPHLNGKYTIFGKLIAGMDVVHDIEVGDKINRISISN
ncbi:peptidylprolyl isomerase [Portibacter marinus]|uniref:peptidylprolyl isomerase n=1 Tax=Portibacter marinus TaxID=2898660 RepID=UPI001F36D4B8|nr:peptidylprolyl isomerase [Portibacter marinus]